MPTSSIGLLVVLPTSAVVFSLNVIAGSIRLMGRAGQPCPIPEAGNQPKFNENTITNTRASQKVGQAALNRARMVITLSVMEYCLSADSIPTGIPTTTASVTAVPQRISVLPILFFIWLPTSRLFL